MPSIKRTKKHKKEKMDLCHLLKTIPDADFENRLREWMEAENITGTLQAKLRMHLIGNFNKTFLGRHMTSISSNNAGTFPCLVVSPLLLALNTLVSEFLYAQNCHFTLSVYCAEIPYHSALPNFDQPNFRFSDNEIKDIYKAICSGGAGKADTQLLNNILLNYKKSENTSLLLDIMQALLSSLSTRDQMRPKQRNVGTNTATLKMSAAKTNKATQNDYDSHFRYLNKYLLVLAEKVGDMTQKFESFQKRPQRHQQQRTKQTAGGAALNCDSLNRSLERLTENLKRLSRNNCQSKDMLAIVMAIETLGAEFSRCSQNFEDIALTINSVRKPQKLRFAERETQTDSLPAQYEKAKPSEKPYLDWLHELRASRIGKKFLNRVEAVLQKALHKQKQQMEKEFNIKFLHQRELLKMHFKNKMLEQIAQQQAAPQDFAEETRNLNKSIEVKLREFEEKHLRLYEDMRERQNEFSRATSEKVEQANNNIQTSEANSKTSMHTVGSNTDHIPIFKDVENTQKQMQQIVQDVASGDENMENLLLDSRLRIEHLEMESMQMQRAFLKYLERQRIEKEKMRHALEIYNEDANKLNDLMPKQTQKQSVQESAPKMLVEDIDFYLEMEKFKANNKLGTEVLAEQKASSGIGMAQRMRGGLEMRNAISDAKLKFFAQDWGFNEDLATPPTHIGEFQELNLQGINVHDKTEGEEFAFAEGLHNKNNLPTTEELEEQPFEVCALPCLSLIKPPELCLNLSDSSDEDDCEFMEMHDMPAAAAPPSPPNVSSKVKPNLHLKRTTAQTTLQAHNNLATKANSLAKTKTQAATNRSNNSSRSSSSSSSSESNKSNKADNKQQQQELEPADVDKVVEQNHKIIAGKSSTATTTTTKAAATPMTSKVLKQSMQRMKQLFTQIFDYKENEDEYDDDDYDDECDEADFIDDNKKHKNMKKVNVHDTKIVDAADVSNANSMQNINDWQNHRQTQMMQKELEEQHTSQFPNAATTTTKSVQELLAEHPNTTESTTSLRLHDESEYVDNYAEDFEMLASSINNSSGSNGSNASNRSIAIDALSNISNFPPTTSKKAAANRALQQDIILEIGENESTASSFSGQLLLSQVGGGRAEDSDASNDWC